MTALNTTTTSSLVELILKENRSLGLKIQKVNGGRIIKLLRLEEYGQAEASALAQNLNPNVFVNSIIVGVDGQRYVHGGEVYTALRLTNRPKRILVQLTQQQQRGKEEDDTVGALPVTRRRASLLKQKATFATESMRQLTNSMEEMDRMNDELEKTNIPPPPSSSITDPSPSARARKILGFLRDAGANTRFVGFPSPRVGGLKKNMIPLRDELPLNNNTPLSERDDFHHLDDDEQREILKKEAREACLQAIRDHYEAYIEENPTCTYEEWIEELHPENAKSKRNLVKGHSIDHRLYTENSDHRKIWNSKLGNGLREYVPVRAYGGAVTKSSIRGIHEYEEEEKGDGINDVNNDDEDLLKVKKSFTRAPPPPNATTTNA